jgi:hypothetical protein
MQRAVVADILGLPFAREAGAARGRGEDTRDLWVGAISRYEGDFRAALLAAAEAQYRPQYAQLDFQILRDTLLGKDGQPGLLSTYEQDISPSLARAANADRSTRIEGEMGDITRFAPQIAQTLREASGNAPLLEEMNRQALEDLRAGAGMSPELSREVQQGVRSAQAARGFGFGAPDAVTEAFARGSRGLQLQQQRRQNAAGMVGLNQATGGDPFMAILGRPSQTMGMMPGVAGQAAGFNPGAMFNPESAYAGDIFNTNYNAQAAANIQSANNKNALIGAGISAAGSMGSNL